MPENSNLGLSSIDARSPTSTTPGLTDAATPTDAASSTSLLSSTNRSQGTPNHHVSHCPSASSSSEPIFNRTPCDYFSHGRYERLCNHSQSQARRCPLRQPDSCETLPHKSARLTVFRNHCSRQVKRLFDYRVRATRPRIDLISSCVEDFLCAIRRRKRRGGERSVRMMTTKGRLLGRQ